MAFVYSVVTTAANPTLAQSDTEADQLNAEAISLYQAGNYSEAIPLAQRALALRENALGSEHPDLATSLNRLGELYRAQGRYDEAEPLFKRSLAISENALGAEHPSVAAALNNLAGLYRAQGRYGEAEPLYKRSLAISENALGAEHPSVAAALNNLAGLYTSQGRYGEAEPLYKRSLAISENALGADHPSVAAALNNLAAMYEKQRRYGEAEPLYKRSLAIREKAVGADHSNVATALHNLAGLYRAQGRFGEAEPLLKRSLAIIEKVLDSDHPSVAIMLNSLGGLYQTQGRFGEAEPLYKRSLAIGEKALGPDHPSIATVLNNLAFVSLAHNDIAGAAGHWRRATTLLQRRAERGLDGASEGSSKSEAQQKSQIFEGLVKTTLRLAAEGSSQATPLAREMFETAQWGQVSEVAAALAQMAARSAGASPVLAALVRERQDLVLEWQGKDKSLIAARSELPENRSAATEKQLADRLLAIDVRLAAIDARFAAEFPDYATLASSKSVGIAEVQAILGEDEALILFLHTDERFKPLPEETFVWIVTKTDGWWLRSDLGTAAISREVAALRCGLDGTAWNGDGAKRCSQLLKLPIDKVPAEGAPLPFDAARSHALYRSLLGEAEDLIKDKHLLIVPSGALTTLPFQVLVTKPPASDDLASASWLVRDHAITVLPSVTSLTALRRTGKPSAAPKPVIGFGNPLLDGNQEHPQFGDYYRQQAKLARAHTGCAKTTETRTAALRVVRRSAAFVPPTSRLADLDHLRVQTPLPETADELCEVVRSAGGKVDDVWIGARATETEIKRLSSSGELAQYRNIHFATHGTLAGQLSGTSEPGLILSPPSAATADDDGYLSGSEIANLKLDANWVILSACNTAGGAGEGEAAEALSGLARVFIYAGARALLVSHWEVDSYAAVKLVTGAVGALAKDPGIGRAEAQRSAILTAMSDTTRPANWVPAWHPSVWAPFAVVGEGGAGR